MRMSVREFKARLSRYLVEARAGRSGEISSLRKVVTRLMTGSSWQGQVIERLLAQGLAQWDGSKPSGASIRVSSGGRLPSDLIREDRG